MKYLLVSALLFTIPALVASDCGTPSVSASYSDAKLPDPFHFVNGTAVTTKGDFQCRQQEISALLQSYELGTLPPAPSQLTASLTSTSLTITATEGGKSITFTPTISLPTTGKAPFPALIAFAGLSLPRPSGVAIITFNNDDLAAEVNTSSRGQGKFYQLYGSNASAGAMIAWAWGVSRIIDALEMVGTSTIDTTRIGVTGCSRDGKGAMVAGAFDSRIALTIAQESGSGGAACWRLSDAESASGSVVQTASEIVTENVWFSTSFNQFVNNTSRLPFDHHMLAGLIAPRAFLSFENTEYVWLSPWSSHGCMQTANMIWQALGVPDFMGFSQDGNHSHCAFPADQQPELTAYFNRFLLGQNANTSVMKSPETFNQSQWIDWTVPTLT